MIKISLPLPHHPPSSTPQLRHVSLCYELASCLGAPRGSQKTPSAPTWAHVANTSTPLSGTAGHRVLPTTSFFSSPLQLPASSPAPSFGLSQSPIAPRCQGPSRRTDGQQPQVLGFQLRTLFLGRSFPLPGPAASESKRLSAPLRPA